MRLYGKRFLRQGVSRQISSKKETRDAVVYDLLPAQRLARVQIQGSSTLVMASYPSNLSDKPSFIKPGNVVRINFVGGNRNRFEILEQGFLRPSTATAIVPGTADDDVLSGIGVYPIPYNPRMAIMVKVGTYRIAGVTYTLPPIGLGQYDPWYLGDGGALGEVAAIIAMNAAPSAGYRYDYIVAGADLIVDYIPGTDFTSSPVYPTIPSGHVLLGTVFVNSVTTKITASEINYDFGVAIPCNLLMEIADDQLDAVPLEESTTITVSILDQYGAPWPGTYEVGLYMFSGNGTLSHGGDSTTDLNTKIDANTSPSSHAVFTYTRLGGAGDIGPMICAQMSAPPNLVNFGAIFVVPVIT